MNILSIIIVITLVLLIILATLISDYMLGNVIFIV